MNAMALENQRLELAWFALSFNPNADIIGIDLITTVRNRIEDHGYRFTKEFTFKRKRGWIDGNGYVCWGGMGMHFECIGNPEFLAAIAKQTGITC